MSEKQEKVNTFAEMESKSANSKVQETVKQKGEISIENFSDVAIGDKVKYVRPDLNGKKDVINKFQVFMPDTTEALKESKSGSSKYWPVTMILTYDSTNTDGVQNREYISGAICFQQKDGSASEPSFWYEGCEHQSGMLWEKVAKSLNLEPDKLSPRQFVAFLNGKPGVVIKGIDYKNFGALPGQPKFVKKNMPREFI